MQNDTLNFLMVLGGGLGAIGGILLGAGSYQIKKKNQEIKRIKAMPYLTPKQVAKGFEEDDPVITSSMYQTDRRGEIAVDLIVDGQLLTENPLTGRLSPVPDLAVKINKKKELFSNEVIPTESEFRLDDFKWAPSTTFLMARGLRLSDENDSKYKLQVQLENPHALGISKEALTFIGTQNHLRKLNILDQIGVFIGKIGAFLASLRDRPPPRGIYIGFNESEVGVKLGTLMTVCGSVVFNVEQKAFKIKPQFMGMSRLDILGMIERQKVSTGVLITGAAIAVIGGGLFIFAVAQKRHQANLRRRRRE